MNTLFKTLGLAAALVLAFVGSIRAQDSPSYAQDDQDTASNGVSFQTFYDDLASQGTWINTDQYGYVFQPTESDPNWRPYTYGHWVNTPAGMTWVSDDSFGWATDHYGRWTNLDGIGWVWVPGYTWAPAWVSWRQDDTDVGWAPLPPDSEEGIDYYGDDDYYDYGDYYDPGFYFGFHIGDDCDLVYGIGPWWYNFCPIAYIGDRDCWRHFHDRRDNFGFIRDTRNVTNINYNRNGEGRFGHVRVEGPNVAALNERAHTPIPTARLDAATRMNEAGLHGDTLAVFAPRISRATAGTARPDVVSRTVASTTVNHGTDLNRPLVVNSHLSPGGPTSAQLRAADVASGASALSARVATTHTTISRPLTRPLTALHTTPRMANAATHESFRTTPSASAPGESPRSSYAAPITRNYSPTPETYHPSSVFPHTSTRVYGYNEPAYRESVPSYYHPQESYRSYSAPAYHYSAPSYHYSAPSYHYSAPSYHYSEPAAHFSGGGFGGGGFRSSGGFSGGGHGGGGGGGGGHR